MISSDAHPDSRGKATRAITYLDTVPKLRMSGAIPPVPLRLRDVYTQAEGIL